MGYYAVRYVHKVSQRATDKRDSPVFIPDYFLPSKQDGTHKVGMGAYLRREGVLALGAIIRVCRLEDDGRLVIFPYLRGSTTYWHSVILTPCTSTGEPR